MYCNTTHTEHETHAYQEMLLKKHTQDSFTVYYYYSNLKVKTFKHDHNPYVILQNDSTEIKSKFKASLILIKEIPVLGGGGGGGGASYIFMVSAHRQKLRF